jgi:hypothetical protein
MKAVLKSAVVFAAILAVAPATAGVLITQQTAAAPTYATTLNFDEPGGPTGPVAPTTWTSSLGITIGNGLGSDPYVGPNGTTQGLPWLGTGNSLWADWGTFMTFSNKLTAFSAQDWDNAGKATMFTGGMWVAVLNGGVEVASVFLDDTPWSDTAPSWFNITTDGGSVFDEVRFVGNSWIGSSNVIDNLSWNTVPEPTSLALFAAAVLLVSRRRAP